MYFTINYACKEFEQTGISEIERVYLNTEARLETNSLELHSAIKDTFHYESGDASKKHFEKFYQTSLKNNIVRNLSILRSQYYRTEQKEIECFDSTYSKILKLENSLLIEVSGEYEIESLDIPGELNEPISQNWKFKISTNSKGELAYIESLDKTEDKLDELKRVMRFLYNLKLNKSETIENQNQSCWKLELKIDKY